MARVICTCSLGATGKAGNRKWDGNGNVDGNRNGENEDWNGNGDGDGNRNRENEDWNGNGDGDGNRNGDGKREREFEQKLQGQRRLKLWVIFFTNKTRDD